ncbi:hypothetical protein BJX70DRAFT_363580 [Aspergillus crustosus]
MSISSDLKDISMPGWTPQIATEYYAMLNSSTDGLDMTSPQPTDSESSSQTPSPPPSTTNTSGLRKRGRPRLLNSKGVEIANKERRKTQVRLAQRAFRERKEEKMSTLSNKVTELEQKLIIARTLYLSTHAAVMSSDFPVDPTANPYWRLLHDNLQLLLANTEIQSPSSTLDLSMESIATSPSDESYSLLLDNASLNQATPQDVMSDNDYFLHLENAQLYQDSSFSCLYSDDIPGYATMMAEDLLEAPN